MMRITIKSTIIRRRQAAALILSVLAMALPAGCQYRAGFLIPPDVRSVHIRVAENKTFWRDALKTDNLDTSKPLAAPRPAHGMNLDLSERLKNEIVRRTPLKIRNEEAADSVLTAAITGVKPSVLLRDAGDSVLSARVTISVDFVWTDRRNGRVLARGENIVRPTDFLAARGESFTTASRKSFNYIAERIVERMQEGF